MSLFGKFTKKENTTSPSSVLPTIIETLTKAGYKSQRQTESCVGYDDDGLYCNFCYLENDPEFLLAQATFERGAFSAADELLLHQICAKVNASQKAGKVYIDGEGELTFTVEAFIPSGTPIDLLALHMAKLSARRLRSSTAPTGILLGIRGNNAPPRGACSSALDDRWRGGHRRNSRLPSYKYSSRIRTCSRSYADE